MNAEVISTLLQASPVTGLVFGFLYFMSKNNRETAGMVNKFTSTINGYLKDANKVQANLAVKLHAFSETHREFNETNKELKDALEKIYLHNKTIVDENRRLKAQSAGQS